MLTAALVYAASLLLLSVLASKASSRLGVPALLLFILLGVLAGSEGPGNIYFDDYSLAQTIGIVALAFILYSGGLDTSMADIRPVLGSGISLATIGTAVSAVIVAGVADLMLGFTPLEGLLLGAIVSSTDAAAVFGVLRAQALRLRGKLQPLIELESGSNDPMAVFLTIGVLQLLTARETSPMHLVGELLLEMFIGAAAGILVGRLTVWIINRLRLDADGLYPVLTIAAVLLCYGGTSLVGGNGFLAVYVAGVVTGNRRFLHRRSLIRFHDGVGWVMQIAMFLTLGLLVFPSRLVPVAGTALLMALVLVFVARPVSVFIALAASGLNWREKLMVAWAGLRGAVPIVLATFPPLAGVPNAGTMFDVVFFVVITSVLLQGTTIGWVARKLGVIATAPAADEMLPERRQSELVTLAVDDDSEAAGSAIVELPLPTQTTVLLVFRDGAFFTPTGSTVLNAGDKVMALASKESIAETRKLFGDD